MFVIKNFESVYEGSLLCVKEWVEQKFSIMVGGMIIVINKAFLPIYYWQNSYLFDVDVIESRVERRGKVALCSESEIRETVQEDIQRLKRAKHESSSGISILVLERDLMSDE